MEDRQYKRFLDLTGKEKLVYCFVYYKIRDYEIVPVTGTVFLKVMKRVDNEDWIVLI